MGRGLRKGSSGRPPEPSRVAVNPSQFRPPRRASSTHWKKGRRAPPAARNARASSAGVGPVGRPPRSLPPGAAPARYSSRGERLLAFACPDGPARRARSLGRRSVSCSATCASSFLLQLAALRGGVRLAGESLLYLTAINWFGRGRHMTTGFIDASGVDLDCEVRLLPGRWVPPRRTEWARDPRIKTSRAGASQAR